MLIYIYTDWRLMKFLDMKSADVDLDTWTMTGGEKTALGKHRVIPIWAGVRQIVSEIMQNSPGGVLHSPP